MAHASSPAGMLQPVSKEDEAAPPLRDVNPRDAFAIRSTEYDQIAEILDRVGTVQQNLPKDAGDGGEPRLGLNTVLNDLLGIFSGIGTYGLLFKLASFIKVRVEQMQAVDDNAKKVLKLATYIMSSFEKVEIRFTLSNHVVLEEGAETFCNCATLLQIIYRQDQGSLSCCGKALKWLSKFCSAPMDQQQLLDCIDMLKEFRQNLLVALVSAPPAPALPLVESPRFGIDDQIDGLLQFFQKSKDGDTCVLSICGLKGVGKSRLMFEVMNGFPKSPFESFFTMDFAGARDGHHVQRELLQHLSGTAREENTSIPVGKMQIKTYLQFFKTKERRVLLAFDNVDKAEDLTSILPLKLSEVLPPGSCVLISLANNTTASSAALRGVEDIFPAVARKVHVVPTLKFQDAKNLFVAYAGEERPSDDELLDDLVDRCDGLPVLLQLVGSIGFKRARTWTDWEQVRKELTRVDNIIPVTVAVQNMQSGQEDLSQTSRDKLLERLSSKLRVIYGGLDEDLREAIADIGNLFSGWDWQTVECIFGTEMMERLQEKSLISSKSSNAQGLTNIANLTRFSGPGPWKTKLVTMDGFLDVSAVGQYLYLQAIAADGTLTNVRSICLKDSEEPITGAMLDKARDLPYLVLHNTKLRGNCVNQLLGLEFLYWGFDEGSEVRFPFDAGALPKLRVLMINAKDLDLRSFKVPPTVVQLTLEACSITEQASKHMLMSRNLEGLRIRRCHDLTGLSHLRISGQLRKLCLEQCEVPRLPQAIARLHQLTEVELLSCQNLELIGTGTIGALSNLRRLHIIDCRKLKEVAKDLKNLFHLTHLSFAFCSELTGDLNFITGLTKLEELIFTGCSSLEKLPSHVGNLQNLQKLSLVACVKLEQLPGDIGRLIGLQEMGLDFCPRLKALPSNIAELPRLQRLSLSCCSQLKELPQGLEGLRTLEYLNLLGCRSLIPPTQLIEELRHKDVIVHVQETDLRTSYRRRWATPRRWAEPIARPSSSAPSDSHDEDDSGRTAVSDRGPITRNEGTLMWVTPREEALSEGRISRGIFAQVADGPWSVHLNGTTEQATCTDAAFSPVGQDGSDLKLGVRE